MAAFTVKRCVDVCSTNDEMPRLRLVSRSNVWVTTFENTRGREVDCMFIAYISFYYHREMISANNTGLHFNRRV